MDQSELISKNLRPLRLDAIPAEVATEYLTTPGAKLSGNFRRTCHYARASYYVSTNTPKPIESKLERRFSRWPIDKLARQLKRTERRIRMANGALSRIAVEHLREQIVRDVLQPLVAVYKEIIFELAEGRPKRKVIADAA